MNKYTRASHYHSLTPAKTTSKQTRTTGKRLSLLITSLNTTHAVTQQKEILLERRYHHQSFLNYLQIHDLNASLIEKSKKMWKDAIRDVSQANSRKGLEKAIELANKAVGIRVRSDKIVKAGQNCSL